MSFTTHSCNALQAILVSDIFGLLTEKNSNPIALLALTNVNAAFPSQRTV